MDEPWKIVNSTETPQNGPNLLFIAKEPVPGRFSWLIHGREVLAFEPDGTVFVRGQKVDDNFAIYAQVKEFFLVTGPSSATQRLRDLVRHQRGALHDAELITDAEYAELAGDHGAVARLSGYDELQGDLRVAKADLGRMRRAYEKACEALVALGQHPPTVDS